MRQEILGVRKELQTHLRSDKNSHQSNLESQQLSEELKNLPELISATNRMRRQKAYNWFIYHIIVALNNKI